MSLSIGEFVSELARVCVVMILTRLPTVLWGPCDNDPEDILLLRCIFVGERADSFQLNVKFKGGDFSGVRFSYFNQRCVQGPNYGVYSFARRLNSSE